MEPIGRAHVLLQPASEIVEVDDVGGAKDTLRKHALELLEISDAMATAAAYGWTVQLRNMLKLSVTLTYEGTWAACQDAADHVPPGHAVIWRPLNELGTGVIIPGRPHLGVSPNGWVPAFVWNVTSGQQHFCDSDEVAAAVLAELEHVTAWLTHGGHDAREALEQLDAAREQRLRPYYTFAAPSDQDPRRTFVIHVTPRQDIVNEGYASGWANRDAPYTHYTQAMADAWKDGWDLGAGARDQLNAP